SRGLETAVSEHNSIYVRSWAAEERRRKNLCASRRSDCSAGAVCSEIYRFQKRHALIGDIVADHAIAFALQFLQIDIDRVEPARALGDDSRIEQRLHEDAENIALLAHALAAHIVGHHLLESGEHLIGIEAKFLVHIALLVRRDEIEQQRLEAVRRPILD